MFLYTLLLISCAPFAVLAGTPCPLKSLSGRDYSHHLKRTDEPFPIRLTVAKRGAAAVPRTLQVPDVPAARRSSPAGVLVAARQVSCESGYSMCADNIGCCPTGAQCCTDEALCCSGGACCGGSCCENNGVCCGSAGCCNSGNTCQTVNGVTGCCPAGQTCDAFSGCADPSLVECSGLPFCCPSGETCGRDSAGNATCNGHSANSDNSLSTGASSVTPGNTSLSTPGSQTSTTRNNGSGSTTGTVTAPQGTSTLTGSHTTTASGASQSSGGAFKSTVNSAGLALILGALTLVMN